MSADASGYPLPSYATTIWLDGTGNLCLALPSGPQNHPHVVRIPLAKCSIEKSEGGGTLGRQMGWQTLLEILKQKVASQTRPVRLGDRASPVQYDIEAMLGAMHSGSTNKRRRFNERGTQQLDYQDLFADMAEIDPLGQGK